MPLPFLLAGAAIAAAGWGVKKGLDAKSDFDVAKNVNEEAQEIFDDAKRSLERCREKVQNNLESLGRQKIRLSQDAQEPFVETFRQIKNVDYKDIDSQDENLRVSSDEILKIREVTIRMEEVAGGTAGALGSGVLAGLAAYGSVGLLGTASTGTAIAGLSGAAATNATLAWLGGGSLAAGGFGMAGGATVLGGIVAGPVLLVGGLMLASKAEEAKENARSNRYKARAAAEAMKTAEAAAHAIGREADEVQKVLKRLQEDHLYDEIARLRMLVSSNPDYRTYDSTQRELVGRTVSLAVTARNLAEAPLLEEDGSITQAIRQNLKQTKAFLQKLEDKNLAEAPLAEAPLQEEDGSITQAIQQNLKQAKAFLQKLEEM